MRYSSNLAKWKESLKNQGRKVEELEGEQRKGEALNS